MSDASKPTASLAVEWREEADQLEKCITPMVLDKAPKSAEAHKNMARTRRYCADQLEQFVRDHLQPETEPSAEDRQLARECTDSKALQATIALQVFLVRNAERQRIADLLAGKAGT